MQFFVDMFTKFGNAKAVNKALERLVQQNKLYRISTGIYVLPSLMQEKKIFIPL
jgi:predicted transcriptional regulator of viral defense system